MESAHSIRFLYQHILSGITEKSLNAFYYACSYAKVDYSGFINITACMALKLIPHFLRSQPIFLCIDDTMVAKFGTKFDNVSKLFDHAIPNTTADFLCMAGKDALEPDREFMDGLHSLVSILIQMEH